MPRLWDVTLPYFADLPAWPGEPKPVVERMHAMADGHESNVTRLDAGMHFGTHVDAPCHFIDGAAAVEAMPLDVLVGSATVIDVGGAEVITTEMLEATGIADGADRVLFKTRNSRLWDNPSHEFYEDFVALTPDAARWVVANGIRLVGIDYMSIQLFHDPDSTTHEVLLGAGVVIVEGLDLRAVSAGTYDLMCLPLKLVGSDGAPARVVLAGRDGGDVDG